MCLVMVVISLTGIVDCLGGVAVCTVASPLNLIGIYYKSGGLFLANGGFNCDTINY